MYLVNVGNNKSSESLFTACLYLLYLQYFLSHNLTGMLQMFVYWSKLIISFLYSNHWLMSSVEFVNDLHSLYLFMWNVEYVLLCWQQDNNFPMYWLCSILLKLWVLHYKSRAWLVPRKCALTILFHLNKASHFLEMYWSKLCSHSILCPWYG